MKKFLTTRQVATMAGVHRDTLLRWLREGRIREPSRDRNGWRAFSHKEAKSVALYAKGDEIAAGNMRVRESVPSYVSPATRLKGIDWDFADANTGYLTHAIHPYPAKFIPQIPNALIQAFSSIGDTVLDPFCGSGTTLAEALLLKRRAVGVDANPLACLIARAKTCRLTEADIAQLRDLEDVISALALQTSDPLPLFPALIPSTPPIHPRFEGIDFWFDSHVIDELARVKALCLAIKSEVARQVALTALSSIIVTVSRQDSDTRYVRRDKKTQPGDTLQRFTRSLSSAINRSTEFTELTEARFTCNVIHANVLDRPDVGAVDLVVCSPPYPNAFSYHLYHRTRMLWLDMDQPTFKQVEIGSHRKYSKKNGAANTDTFTAELVDTLRWLHKCLRPGGYACFVIGDSLLKGELVHNNEILIQTAKKTGYDLEDSWRRRMQDSKKSFNPAIGKIKSEHIVILRNKAL